MVIFGIDLVLLIPALMISATPVLLAAIGEAVVEKSGVLNLGVEGIDNRCCHRQHSNRLFWGNGFFT